jgi:hypothetical protein
MWPRIPPERLRPLVLTAALLSACSSVDSGGISSSTPVSTDGAAADLRLDSTDAGPDATQIGADSMVEAAIIDGSVPPPPDVGLAPMIDASVEADAAAPGDAPAGDAPVVEPDAPALVPPDAAVVPPDAAVVPPDAAVVPPDAAALPADLAPDQGQPDASPCQPGTCKPNAQWVKTATAEADIQTGVGASTVVGVAGGDLYLSATFRRNAVVAGQAVTNMSALDHTDAFVASFSPAGGLQWLRQVHGASDEIINDVTPDPSGNLLMTGAYLATMYVDDLYTHGSGLWVSSLNSAGKAAWLFGRGNYPTSAYSVAGDAAGNLYLCGFYTTSIQFDDLTLTGDASNKLFIASFGPDRKVRWLRDLGQTFMPSIVVRGVDDIVVAGSYLQLHVGGQTWNAMGFWDVFFVALGAGGVPSWTTVFPGPSPVTGRGIIRGVGVDSTGAVYASGEFADTSGMHPVAVVALSPAGVFKWSLTTASIGAAPSSPVLAVGNDDAVYFAARIAGNVTFGNWSFTHQNDTYLVRFDADGRVRWALDFGDTPTFPSGLAPLPGGRIGLAGTVQNQSALLGLPLRADGAAVPTALYLLSLKQP